MFLFPKFIVLKAINALVCYLYSAYHLLITMHPLQFSSALKVKKNKITNNTDIKIMRGNRKLPI